MNLNSIIGHFTTFLPDRRSGYAGRARQVVHYGKKKQGNQCSRCKIDPVEVENVLMSYDKIKEAFVFGVTSKRGTEIIKAIIVAEKECNLGEIIGYCKDRLADYKVPRIVVFKDNIPRDILGKALPVNMEG